MKLLCDEGVERQIVEGLRKEGHEVLYVAEMSSGISDDEVLELSSSQDAVLVTKDKDFGELVFRQGLVAPGVLLVRLHGLEAARKVRIVTRAVAEHAEELRGAFSVVDKEKIRIRRQAW